MTRATNPDPLALAPRGFLLHLHGVRPLVSEEVAAVHVVVLQTVPPSARTEAWWSLMDAATRDLWRTVNQSAEDVFALMQWAALMLHIHVDGTSWIEAIE
jgi:hypothetical protein